jgi:lipopolysaccharide transport system permease protein
MSALTVIRADSRDQDYWLNLWNYRELLQILAWRDISVRYKQTIIGVSWALIRPLLTMIILSVVFGALAKLPSDGAAPYSLLVLSGILPWGFFSSALADASNSLISGENAKLLNKVYFPRLIIPLAAIVVSLVDFAISCSLLLILMVWYKFVPGWEIVFLPLFLLLAFCLSLGVGAWVTALNVKYRDFRYVIPFMLQVGLYISPVGFSSSIVPDDWRLLYSINPLVGIIDGFRWCLFGGQTHLYVPGVFASVMVTFGLTWLGIRKFRDIEKRFADLI